MLTVDCGNDTEVMTFEVTRNTESLTHGTITTHTCVRDSCPFDRTCFNGMWNGTLPSCEGTFIAYFIITKFFS